MHHPDQDDGSRRPLRRISHCGPLLRTGAAGLAATLGAAIIVAATHVSAAGSLDTVPLRAIDIDRQVPAGFGESASPSAFPSLPESAGPGATSSYPGSTGPSTTPSLTAEQQRRVDAVRAAARNTEPITHPLSPPAAVPLPGLTVENHGSLQRTGRTVRIVSAGGDLTGQRELAWVADRGWRVGRARCSDTIRLSPDLAPTRQPTLLLCWRTSARRSVYTVMVDVTRRGPSAQASVATIDAVWRRLR